MISDSQQPLKQAAGFYQGRESLTSHLSDSETGCCAALTARHLGKLLFHVAVFCFYWC